MDFQWKWQAHPELDKIKWWKINCQEAEHLFCVPIPLPTMHLKQGLFYVPAQWSLLYIFPLSSKHTVLLRLKIK